MDVDTKAFELYRVYKSYEEHENDLLNHRTGWLVTVQSVLIATFGFSFQKYFEVMQKASTDRALALAALVNANLTAKHSAPQFLKITSDALNALQAGPFPYRYPIFLIILAIIGILTSVLALSSINAAIMAQEAVRASWEVNCKAEADRLRLPDIAGGGNPKAAHDGGTAAKALPILLTILWVGILIFVLSQNLDKVTFW